MVFDVPSGLLQRWMKSTSGKWLGPDVFFGCEGREKADRSPTTSECSWPFSRTETSIEQKLSESLSLQVNPGTDGNVRSKILRSSSPLRHKLGQWLARPTLIDSQVFPEDLICRIIQERCQRITLNCAGRRNCVRWARWALWKFGTNGNDGGANIWGS